MKQLLTLLLSVALTDAAAAQTETTLRFDDSGIEQGVTTPGASTFSVAGSSWTGGTVDPTLSDVLRSSGTASYSIPGQGRVVFDNPIAHVKFFFVHGDPASPGKATAFGASGHPIAEAESRLATTPSDPANFVSLQAAEPIVRIELRSAVVDDFTFVTEGDCPDGSSLCGHKHLLSVSAGDKQVLRLDAGPLHRHKLYLLLASAAGTTPGIPLDSSMVLPLNVDGLLLHTRAHPNTAPLARSMGFLDANGTARATFYLEAGSPMFTPGTTVHLAYLVRGIGGFDFVSKPEFATIVP